MHKSMSPSKLYSALIRSTVTKNIRMKCKTTYYRGYRIKKYDGYDTHHIYNTKNEGIANRQTLILAKQYVDTLVNNSKRVKVKIKSRRVEW